MEKNDKKSKHIFFWIITALSTLLYLVFLELSKNTVLGWILAAVAVAVLIVCEVKFLKVRKKLVHLGLWAGLMCVFALISVISAPPYKQLPAVDYKNPAVTAPLKIAQGELTGVYSEDKAVEVYAGIPYAKPPVGELRWQEPQEPEKWEGVRACDHFAPMSMQHRDSEFVQSMTSIIGYHNYKISLDDNFREAVSEDSLYLNVWKPQGEVKNAPVLVYIHGGYLMTGQSSFSEYRGEDLAKQGIVVVTIAYRLGVFGYMANEELQAQSPKRTTGNYGLLDQIQALKWVQQNIAAFGGDPQQVTVAGESAGASSVNALCVSPLAKGLFRYAIAESSGITPKVPYHTFRTFEDALQMGKDILEEFGCENVAQLREIDAEKLVQTQYENNALSVDGYAITEQPYLTYQKGNNNEQALLNGYNSHEANVFNLFAKVDKAEYEDTLEKMFGATAAKVEQQYPYNSIALDYDFAVEAGGEAKGTMDYIWGGTWFAYSHYKWSEYMAAQKKPVYFYCFTKDNRSLRANHGGELPYAYGNLWRHDWLYDKSDYALSETMQSYWVNFVKTGNPNGEGLPVWAPYAESKNQVLSLGEEVNMAEDMYKDLYPLIDEAQNRS
ncbi:MAG: carboxylesterase family protein [Ruminococcaceae bacterium]|nr:carboxylesterase family protein [Oscillospiraceae bacterium]